MVSVDLTRLQKAAVHHAPIALPARYDELSPAQRTQVRSRYIWQQHGLCHHCAAELDGLPAEAIAALPVDVSWFPESFFQFPIHLHHDHDTGLTVGAVHAHCNAVLWQYEGK